MATDCDSAGFAAANFGRVQLMVQTYHHMWYPDSDSPGNPTPDEEGELRHAMRDRNLAYLEKLQEKLRKTESESPGGILRSEHHIELEKARLRGKIGALEHEISLLDDWGKSPDSDTE